MSGPKIRTGTDWSENQNQEPERTSGPVIPAD